MENWQIHSRSFLGSLVQPHHVPEAGFSDSIAACLPLDIFVQFIAPRLRIEDIIALRRVNKHWFHLSHEPLIWRNFMGEIALPLPPPRPTINFHDQATDYEYEQHVTRAITVEDNFRKIKTEVESEKAISTNEHQVLDMVLLPAGKYLVASVRNKFHFYIAVYHLEHPSGPQMLARLPTAAKAYNLQAKYVRFEGEPVLMIAYVCRTFKAGGPTYQDPSEFSNTPDIDSGKPMKHEVICARLDLQTLDFLSGVHRDPDSRMLTKHKLWSQKIGGPFTQTLVYAVGLPVNIMSLYEKGPVPYVSITQVHDGPGFSQLNDAILMINLETRAVKTLVCQLHEDQMTMDPPPQRVTGRIRAVRHLPLQDSVLILGTIICILNDHNDFTLTHVAEIIDIPQPDWHGGLTVHARPNRQPYLLGYRNIRGWHISDYTSPSTNGHRTDVILRASEQPLPPISIYLETAEPGGVMHHLLWPAPKNRHMRGPDSYSGPRDFYYDVRLFDHQTVHRTPGLHTRILPGVWRAILYETAEHDGNAAPALLKLRRYINPEFRETSPIERIARDSDAQSKNMRFMPTNVFGDIDINADKLARYKNEGLAAIAWDESIGRLCIATGNNKSSIDVIDFGCATMPDNRFVEWKREREEGYIEYDEDEGQTFLDEHNALPVPKRLLRPEAYRQHTPFMLVTRSMEIDGKDVKVLDVEMEH